MSELQGRWRVIRTGGLLPPLGPMTKHVEGGRGSTRVGPLEAAFHVQDGGGDAVLEYAGPLRVFRDHVRRTADGRWQGEATVMGRRYGSFTLVPEDEAPPTGRIPRGEETEAAIPDRIDEIGRRAQAVVGRFLGRRPALADALHGTWLGHPLHPAVVALPLGAWTTAAAMDVLTLGRARGTRTMTAVGLAGAVVAAASGWADLSRAGATGRRTGVLHAGVNGAATVCMAVSLVSGRRRAMRWRLIGAALVGAGGWLGGELAYGHGLGVDVNAGRTGPAGYVPVARLEELPEGVLTRVDADGSPVALLREGEAVRAVWAVCSHLGGPLDEGRLQDGCVVCPWHGSAFRMEDGAVVHGPATAALPRLQTRVRDGVVEVRGAG
jgi:nitrite reductase/ring-hydroxylating ferredoxin subunit/uncharacterized membrane protein